MNILLPNRLSPYFQTELNQYHSSWQANKLAQAWLHLERAHIIGQAFAVPHTQVHWLMLCYGLRTRNFAEVSGQVIRMILGFIGSTIGKIPVGNTGGANVPMTQPMPIPADLQEILNQKPV